MAKLSTDFDPSALSAKIARSAGAKQVVLEERLQLLWSGYGELWRARLDGEASVVVKHVQPPRDDLSLSHRRKLRSYQVEHAFYRHYAARCGAESGCRVPRPIALLAEDGAWLFVLEDLDQSGYSNRYAQVDASRIEATLRWLAFFHARFMGVAPDELWPVGSYWHLATRPEELRAMRNDALRDAAPRIDSLLNRARFKTLVHGDAKPENVCFGWGDEVALVDFQYVGSGVGVKDVAYFLSAALTAGQYAERVPEYLNRYFSYLTSALHANGSRVDPAELEQEWRTLFPLAWVDFYRFLLGWAGPSASDPYSERLTKELLQRLSSD